MGVAIIGTGSYLPELKLTNKDMEMIVDTSDDWIITRTGIKTRRICPKGKGSSDLAVEAILKAIEDAKIDKDEIEFIICATITPDKFFPSTACIIQKKLGLRNIPCFDFQAACSGFIYGIEIGRGLIEGCGYTTGVVVASECMSRLTDYTDRSTCVLLGDGAGAAILQKSEQDGIIDSYLCSDGNYGDLLYVPEGGSLYPFSFSTLEKRACFMKMEGSTLFKIAISSMSEAVTKILEKNNIKKEDISIIIPHQANLRIINGIAKNLGIPIEKFFVNIEKYGNMSAACVPIALDEAVKEGKIRKGDLVLTVAFGAGLTWASNLIRWVK